MQSKIPYKYYDNIEHINHGLFGAQDSDIPTLDNVDLNTVGRSGNSYLVTNATNYPSSTSANGRLYIIQTAKTIITMFFRYIFRVMERFTEEEGRGIRQQVNLFGESGIHYGKFNHGRVRRKAWE